jgi:hypothetical protein
LGRSHTDSETDPRAGNQNAFLVKRNTNGGVQFSRDPLNLTNLHSRKVSIPSRAEDAIANRMTARWFRQREGMQIIRMGVEKGSLDGSLM